MGRRELILFTVLGPQTHKGQVNFRESAARESIRKTRTKEIQEPPHIPLEFSGNEIEIINTKATDTQIYKRFLVAKEPHDKRLKE